MEIQVCVLVYEEWYVHIYAYISSLSYNSLGSFNNAQQFSSFLDPLPRFHLRRISLFECRFHLSVTVSLDLFLCIPLFLRVYSSIHDTRVHVRIYVYVYVRIFGGCIDASSLMFFIRFSWIFYFLSRFAVLL